MRASTVPQDYLLDPSFIVFAATEPGDVRRIRREVEGRAWAAAHGLPTARTVAVGPDDRWMASRRVADEPGESQDYLEAALDVARRIERIPAPRFRTEGASWAAPRSATVGNALRLAAAGVSPWLFASTRTAAARVPCTVTVHNDFHRANVLRAGPGEVVVIDWEYTSTGPRHHDFLRLLVDVVDADLARGGLESVLRSAPRAEHAAIAHQLRWLALRTYGSEVCIPAADLRPDLVERRRRRWREVFAWTAGL
ncbi:aminoglycoside phosphotransferase family protein [Nocardioides sp. SLBN-35]|uniref:aminoglycoside phosphotransferase family protein n=1 Tax=Nocardioides sp. SLBN-35 TaxID=2768445 RepID=UPI0013578C14|nr:aminoglycoside phosphotransferase family protein [Nocardioides sp. SLBN-35]